MYLGVTGSKVHADDTVKFGLATHFVKHNDLEKVRKELLETFKDKEQV